MAKKNRQNHQWRRILLKFSRYAVVGLSGVGVNMLMFLILRKGMSLDLTMSTALSVETAIINNFIWNDIWTFRSISRQQLGAKQRLERFFKFNSVCAFGLLLNVFIVNRLVNVFQMSDSLALLLAIAIVFIVNFIFHSKISWREKEEHGQQPLSEDFNRKCSETSKSLFFLKRRRAARRQSENALFP